MTITNLTEIIETAFNALPQVEQVTFGDAYQVLDNSQVKYPIVSYAPTAMLREENFVTWTFRIYAAERLTDSKKNTLFNYAELVSILEKGLTNVKNSEGIVDLEYPIRYSLANQKFMDVNTVVYADVNIMLLNDTPLC